MPGDELVPRSLPESIREQASRALRLAPAERMKAFLAAPKPMALVRAIPDGDFYLTVREVGPQDALPALALASSSQIAHLLDLEGWRKDRFDAVRCGAWVALLAEAGEATLRRFARSADDETLILLFRAWARFRPLDIDHEEPSRGHGITETGDERGFISPDGNHLLAPEHPEHAPAARRLAELLFHDDPARYLGLVRSALFELPSDVEEDALRWRLSRLEEHGYPGHEEASAIYEPPLSAAAAPLALSSGGDVESGDTLGAPRAALRLVGADSAIVPALDLLAPDARERVLLGLTALAHRVLVADGADAGSLEAHHGVMERAASYLGVALERRGARTPADAARALAELGPIELFREGYAEAATLQRGARAMLATGWGHGHPKADELLDAPLRARVRGAVQPRPLFVPIGEEGPGTPRDFRTVAEIEETRMTLELCDALAGALLVRRGLTPADLLDETPGSLESVPRFSELLLTALAWHAVRGAIRVDRLPADVVADFLRTTASRRTADPDAPARGMKKLIAALAEEGSWSKRTTAAVSAFGVTCLDRLAADCAGLDPGAPVTRRVVGALRLA